jgi:LacI family transcriptional regulator
MPFTLEDIAKISGYSRSTVSRVINKENGVSEKARIAISKIIEENDYQPNLAARGLASGKSKIFGLVISHGINDLFSDSFYSLLMQGVTKACAEKDYSVMLWLSKMLSKEELIAKITNNSILDGLIISSIEYQDPMIDEIINSKIPFVMVGQNSPNKSIHFVDTNNSKSAFQAVNYFIELGYKRIATITGPTNKIAGRDRLEGYKMALAQNNIEVDPRLIQLGYFSDLGGYSAMEKLLVYQPEAVFVASDTMAFGAIRAIKDAGLQIPDDIALIGFDNIPTSAEMSPPLTTIHQDIQKMGEIAVDMLIDLISNKNKEIENIILPAELIIRESCGTKLKE